MAGEGGVGPGTRCVLACGKREIVGKLERSKHLHLEAVEPEMVVARRGKVGGRR